MPINENQKLIDLLNQKIIDVDKKEDWLSTLLEKIGEARFVLLGEASHGTKEFYETRAAITKELISRKNFMAVAIEGDWPDVHQIHRYLQGVGDPEDYKQALNTFERFPTWMWRNKSLVPFLKWLRGHNDHLNESHHKIGFYGLDLYSLYRSIQAVLTYLTKVDPMGAQRAKKRYACFDHFNIDPQIYSYLTNLGIKKPCLDEAIEQLIEMQYHAFDYLHKDGLAAEDEYFYATQNARLVKNAETYYRAMFEGHETSWNVRDTHMFETVNVLSDHLEKRFNKPAQIIIWAHNSHVGDARATEMSERGEINIGQLMREQHGEACYSLGFSTYKGFVTAASDWDEPSERKLVNPGIKGSYEELFHELKYKNFLLNLVADKELEHYLKISRLQRAIGVIYRPETERLSHYFFTCLPYQFNSMIHLDETDAVEPL